MSSFRLVMSLMDLIALISSNIPFSGIIRPLKTTRKSSSLIPSLVRGIGWAFTKRPMSIPLCTVMTGISLVHVTDDASLLIPVVEPLLRLWQMAEHDGDNRQCLTPVNPVNSLFHTTKVIFYLQITKSSSFFL